MFISPKVAIERGWIKGIKDPAKQVQPNAIDFTLDKVMVLNTDLVAVVGESRKVMRPLYPYDLEPAYHLDRIETHWSLEGLRVYDGTSDMYVEVPEGVAAILYTRSTFARNGVIIHSGLYDSGFKGNIGFTIYTIGGRIDIEPGTRIGQIAFIHSESAGMYAGGYNHEQGTHYTDRTRDTKDIFFGEGPDGAGKVPRAPTNLERPIGSNPNKGEVAQELEETHKWDSTQVGKPAGTKSFI